MSSITSRTEAIQRRLERPRLRPLVILAVVELTALSAALFVLGGGYRYRLRQWLGPATDLGMGTAQQAALLIGGALICALASRLLRLPLWVAAVAAALWPVLYARVEQAFYGVLGDSLLGGSVQEALLTAVLSVTIAALVATRRTTS